MSEITSTRIDYTLSKEFYSEVMEGKVPGHAIIHKFGRNGAVPNGLWELIADTEVGVWQLQTAAVIRIKAGGNVADTAAGAGARSVLAEGLDSTGLEVSETIATAGASASSNTTQTFIRTFRAIAATTGTYVAGNTGDIKIESGGVEIIHMHNGAGRSEFGAFTIPLSKTGYLLSVSGEIDGGKAADVRIRTRENILESAAPYTGVQTRLYFDGVLGPYGINPKSPLIMLPALTDIWGEANGSGAQTEGSIDFEILLVDD